MLCETTFWWGNQTKDSVLLHLSSVTRLGDLLHLFIARFIDFSKPVATIMLPKSATFLGNFCKVVKIFHFPSEIIFGLLL